MFRRTFFTAVLVSLVAFQFAPAGATLAHEAYAAARCNWMEFVADMTVSDGSIKLPGETFIKTWRIKNIGSCPWTHDYELFFLQGDQMGAAKWTPMPTRVSPGESVDISVSITAPTSPGHYRGYFILRDESQNKFGMGAAAGNPFWLDILVSTQFAPGYDFAANACSATWRSGAGVLPCPGTDRDTRGYVVPIDQPKLEDGTTDPLSGLLVGPQKKFNGYIQGFYPEIPVLPGDRFQAIVGCAFGETDCLVTFRLDYQINNGAIHTFWQWNEKNEARTYRVDKDLSFLAGANVRFILTTLAAGPDTGDRAIWASPRFVRSGGGVIVPASPTPTSLGPPTVTPPGGGPTPTFTPPGGTPLPVGTVLDLTSDICSADWVSGAGRLPCPMSDGDARGFALRADNPVLENGSTEGLPGLIVAPQNKTDGYLQGFYPYYTVQPGDHFQASVGCANGSPCNVTYRLDYQAVDGGVLHILWKWSETGDNHVFNLDYDLSALAGKRVKLVLTLLASGSATGDRAIWGHPRVVRPGFVPPSPTPLPPTWLTYSNPTHGFKFNYPADAVIVSSDLDAIRMDFSIMPDTNLMSKYLQAIARQTSGECLSNLGGTQSQVTLNGLVFTKQVGSQTPQGQHYDRIAYSTQNGEVCVTLDFFLHWSPTTNWDPPRPEYDRVAEAAIFEQIASTFSWTSTPGASPTFTPTPTATTPAGSQPAGTVFDFASDVCSADWVSGAGARPCPMTDGDIRGFALRAENPVLENGTTEGLPGLIVAPQVKTDGYLQGFYPFYTVQPGDHFQASVGCANGSPCNVKYRLDYQAVPGGVLHILWQWTEAGDGQIFTLDYDLAALAGRNVRFVLTLLANGSPTGDRAVWGHPRIVRTGYVPPTVTPPPTSGWPTYTNSKWGYQFEYPTGGNITSDDGDTLWLNLPTQPNTDLSSKFLIAGARDSGNGCQSYLDPESGIGPQSIVINGRTFLKWSTTEQQMNSLYKTTNYATERETVCLVLGFTLRSGLAYDPPPPAYDEAAESAVFQPMLESFIWSAPFTTPTPTPLPTVTATPTITPTLNAQEGQVLTRANEAVALLRNHDFAALAAYVHPTMGLRFSPYATVKDSDLVFNASQVGGLWTDPQNYHWGNFQGSGFGIDRLYTEYSANFVYDRDFAAAPFVSVNQSLGTGGVPDNARAFYAGATVVEYYFPPSDPQLEGLDWRSLRLVFVQSDSVWYLVGIVHAQWTV